MTNITIISLSDFEKKLQEKNYTYEVTGTVRAETYNLSLDLKNLQDTGRIGLISIIMMLPGTARDSIALYNSLKETIQEYIQQTKQPISVQTDGALYEFKLDTQESEYQDFIEDLQSI